MADITELTKLIKQIASDVIRAQKPVEICFGKVISASPLKINVEQKMTLEAPQLILSRHVTDYIVEMTVDHYTENESGHAHACKGKKKFTVHNGLAVGDEVILLRQQGGQKYLVWDRVGK